MLKQLTLSAAILLLTASGISAEENPEWLAKHKIHVNNCYVRHADNEDGSTIRLESEVIVSSCTWLWNNSREIDWLAVMIRADEYRILGRYDEALHDMNLALEHLGSGTINPKLSTEEHVEFQSNLHLMQRKICEERFVATQADCPEMVVIPPGEFLMGTDNN